MSVNTKNLLENVAKTWKIEAKQEPENLFYYVDEINQLKSGDKSYVIGRKGMGKTAISEYYSSIVDPMIFSERLSFKNFPFNYLYGLSNANYTAPNQYITIWKYLIFNSVCKMMARNNAIDNNLSLVLGKLYPSEPIKALDRLVPKWTANTFGAEIIGSGITIGGDIRAFEASWIQKADAFEDIIEKYGADGSFYYILIDELDEDYRDFESGDQRKVYLSLLTSLFKAVQDIISYFRGTSINIRPIVFLRSDIYALIRDSDKNKWREFVIDLSWTPPKLKEMLCYRLSVSSGESISKNDIWKRVFPQSYIYMGNRGHNRMETFEYITRSTHWRPRDYIHYISECAKLALKNGDDVILATTIKQVDRDFSEYLRNEVIDEIFAVMPNIEQVFAIISQIRKQTFSPKEFLEAYSSATGKTQEEGKVVLRQLFEHSVIGNQASMKGQQIFKHQYPNTLFNFNENMVIHRGLYKALQIF